MWAPVSAMSIRLWFLVIANLFVVGLGIVGFFAIDLFDEATDSYGRAARESTGRVQMSDQIRSNLPDLRALELEYITTKSPETETALLSRILERRQGLRTVMDHYQDAGARRSDAECASCHNVFGQYIHSHEQMLGLAAQGRSADALDLYLISASQYDGLLAEAEKFRDEQLVQADVDIREGEAAGDAARRTLIVAFVSAAALAFVLGQGFAAYVSRRLGALVEGTRRVMSGDLDQPINARGRNELAELGRSFNTMTRSLKAAQQENAALHDAAISLREERIALLSDGLKRATTAQENERRRVSRELHDGIGQALTALQLGLGRLAKTAGTSEAREAAASLKDLTVDTMKEVRDLARDLRPSMLDQIGLAPTLSSYTNTLSLRTGIPIEFTTSGLVGRLPPELEITVFRIAQEALANMARYAEASRASVDLRLAGDTLELVISDDGVGFDVATVRAHYREHLGLAGMEERCRFSDGTFTVTSVPGFGTTVACSWRLTPAAAAIAQSNTGTAQVPSQVPVEGGVR